MYKNAFALVLLLCCSCATDAAGLDGYVDSETGFEMTKPAGWNFVPDAQNKEEGKLVVLTQERLPYNGNTHNFSVEVAPKELLRELDAESFLRGLLPLLYMQTPDFKLTVPVEKTKIDGRKASHAVVEHKSYDANGVAALNTSEYWVVLSDKHVFILSALYAKDDAETRKQIVGILSSIDLDPAN